MRFKQAMGAVLLTVAGAAVTTASATPEAQLSGDYLEVRTCDVFVGPCVLNGEMGLSGKEAMMVWKIREGAWQGARLDGLSVVAVVRTDQTIGDLRYEPRQGKAMLITDARATAEQQEALADWARSQADGVISEIVAVHPAEIDAELGQSGEASVRVPNLVDVSTRGFNSDDHLCGNERVMYPPMASVNDAEPAFTQVAAFHGKTLDRTWESLNRPSAFLGSFAQ